MVSATCNVCGWHDKFPCDVEEDDLKFACLWHGIDAVGKSHTFDGTTSEFFPNLVRKGGERWPK
jgi:hypothetical protein